MTDHLARRIRQARLEAGISQEAMARSLGVTLRTFTRWERGETRRISTDALMTIAESTRQPLVFFFPKGDRE